MKKKHVQTKAGPPPTPARTQPLEQLHQCPACPRVVPLLVEGSDLCVRCDGLHFPELVIA